MVIHLPLSLSLSLSLSPSANRSSSALYPAVKCSLPHRCGSGVTRVERIRPATWATKTHSSRYADTHTHTRTLLISRSPLLTCTSSLSFIQSFHHALSLSLSHTDILADIAGMGKVFHSHLWQNNLFSPLLCVCVRERERERRGERERT